MINIQVRDTEAQKIVDELTALLVPAAADSAPSTQNLLRVLQHRIANPPAVETGFSAASVGIVLVAAIAVAALVFLLLRRRRAEEPLP